MNTKTLQQMITLRWKRLEALKRNLEASRRELSDARSAVSDCLAGLQRFRQNMQRTRMDTDRKLDAGPVSPRILSTAAEDYRAMKFEETGLVEEYNRLCAVASERQQHCECARDAYREGYTKLNKIEEYHRIRTARNRREAVLSEERELDESSIVRYSNWSGP